MKISARAAIYTLVRAMFAVLAVYTLLNGDYEAAAIALLGLALSVLPQIIIRKFKLKLPLLYEIIVLGFIAASILFGELLDVYSSFWWWDSLLHLSSGVIIGYMGYMILFTLHLQGKLEVSAGMVAFLTFSVSMMVAALWEVFEFAVDQLTGARMQNGNADTMKDIVLAMIGSLVATSAAYWHYRWPDNSPLYGELRQFFDRNSHLVSPARIKRSKRL